MLSPVLYEKRLEQEARTLSKYFATDWTNYDFNEETAKVEKRVPRIYFPGVSDIEISEREVEHIKGFAHDKFIRKYDVIYRDRHYLYVVTVDSYWNCVKKFWLSVYIILSENTDGEDDEKVLLFKEIL